ncbi:MAG TPA: peptidase S10 [Thermoanaerobaculia bacterium]|nr:peptidase S10 [Thermoanaerobaculia bacterium]
MTRFALSLSLCLALLSPAGRCLGQEPSTPTPSGGAGTSSEKPKDKKNAEEKPAKEEKPTITRHQMTLGGKPFAYTATTGYMPMKDESGKLKANIFFVAYTKDGAPPRRPITFAFNGGPGSSSVWLHLGALGPRRVLMTDEGWAPPPPYRLVDNEQTWLAFTDLVFIDPVTTGFSRPAEGEKPEQFHGVEEDIQSVGEFIRLYSTRYGRWAAPKFLAGESYGTTRAAGLSGYLQQRYGMYLNGIVLISSILNFQTAYFNEGNDLPFVLFLPSYTTTAWYHKKLPPDLQADLAAASAESEAFAAKDYTLALMKGDRLSGPERQAIVQKLARLTGLSAAVLEENNLRIDLATFNRELLRAENRVVGRLDSRFTAPGRPSADRTITSDPSYSAIYGAYTAMLNDYVRSDLKYENDIPYEILTNRVRPWNYAPYQNQYVNVAETLRGAIVQNPALKVFVAAGYYDFATPYFAAQYTIDHLGLDPALRKNVQIDHFDAGHMMYIHKPSLEKLTKDVTAFYQAAAPEK